MDIYVVVAGGMRNLATGAFVSGGEPAEGLVPSADLTPSASLTPAGA